MHKFIVAAAVATLGQLASAAAAAQVMESINQPYRQFALPVAPYYGAQVAQPPVVNAQRWEVAVSDVTIAKTFERWAAQAGYRLKWDAAKNFLVGAPDVFVGDFEGAVAKVLSSPGIRGSDYPLEVCIYNNTPPLVRVTRQGEQSSDCSAAQ